MAPNSDGAEENDPLDLTIHANANANESPHSSVNVTQANQSTSAAVKPTGRQTGRRKMENATTKPAKHSKVDDGTANPTNNSKRSNRRRKSNDSSEEMDEGTAVKRAKPKSITKRSPITLRNRRA